MKLSSISVKRRPVKKNAFRTLFANVARKKHRAATAAAPMPELEGDVPNLGIARALVVILVIHVVAIAGIFIHSHWFEGDAAKSAGSAKELLEPARPLPDADAVLPTIRPRDKPYMVSSGDTYAKIAALHGMSEEELRAANDNMELRGGRILRIPPEVVLPPQAIVALEPTELTRLNHQAAVIDTPPAATAAIPADELRSAPMVETAAANAPVKVRPGVSRPIEDAAAETPATAAAGRKYTVKNGDTFWKIAQAHGSTPDVIMKANRITDPRKLRAGMQLQVP
jgi:LysM repeat protein